MYGIGGPPRALCPEIEAGTKGLRDYRASQRTQSWAKEETWEMWRAHGWAQVVKRRGWFCQMRDQWSVPILPFQQTGHHIHTVHFTWMFSGLVILGSNHSRVSPLL